LSIEMSKDFRMWAKVSVMRNPSSVTVYVTSDRPEPVR
jgi:hypothetical protein